MRFPILAEISDRRSPLLNWVLLLTIVCWLPYFANTVWPIHDTSYVTECFYCFYSEMFCTGELARWFPYGNYGMPADLYQMALHPTQYAAASMGLLLGVDDTLVLAKIAMLLNELLFAFGLWQLSRELYVLPLTWFLVSAGGMLSVSWFEQSMFNLFVFYLLPLVMCLLMKFFKTGNPTCLYLAGITEVCSLLGNVAYIAPLHFWVLTIFALALAWQYPRSLRNLFTWQNVANPWLWALLFVTAVVGVFFKGAVENLVMLAPGRDAATGSVALDTFLNYGRGPMCAAIFGLITGGIPHGPNTYYVGLLPLAMFVYALATERQKPFIGIAAACVALTSLSLGGQFAKLFYVLPGMSLYRHITLTFGIIGMLLLLGAGFGIERLTQRLMGRETPAAPRRLPRWSGLMAMSLLILADFWFARRPGDFNLHVCSRTGSRTLRFAYSSIVQSFPSPTDFAAARRAACRHS